MLGLFPWMMLKLVALPLVKYSKLGMNACALTAESSPSGHPCLFAGISLSVPLSKCNISAPPLTHCSGIIVPSQSCSTIDLGAVLLAPVEVLQAP
ncbi:hypothetical protein ACFX10_012586 [Malus domestica]